LAGLVACLFVVCEPALANKFETIGSGVSGSAQAKRDWLRLLFFIAAGSLALASVLTVVIPHRNPLYLNYRNWKRSALVTGVLAAALAGAGVAL
jgi:hypothetical protein